MNAPPNSKIRKKFGPIEKLTEKKVKQATGGLSSPFDRWMDLEDPFFDGECADQHMYWEHEDDQEGEESGEEEEESESGEEEKVDGKKVNGKKVNEEKPK